jgi:hypothetical protein
LDKGSKDRDESIDVMAKTVQVMLRGHRFLTIYLHWNIILPFLFVGWVGTFLLWVQLPFGLLSIASMVLILPLLMLPVLYASVRKRLPLLKEAKGVLLEAKSALASHRTDLGLARYVTLLFAILQSRAASRQEEPSFESMRASLKGSNRSLLGQVSFQVLLVAMIFNYFLIPEMLNVLQQGGVIALLLNPVLLLMLALVILMVLSWVVFLSWYQLSSRWLRMYGALQEWGAELERFGSTFGSGDSGGAGQ